MQTTAQSPYDYYGDDLSCEGISLAELAERFGTPLFVYSSREILRRFNLIREAFGAVDTIVAYSVKANSNGAILRLLKNEGAGFDVVSGGELERALRAGADPKRIIFAGVGKTEAEMRRGLEAGVLEFNLESVPEAHRLNRIAGEMGLRAPVALRINPGVDPRTHKFITTGKKENKFGLWLDEARELAKHFGDLPNLKLAGLHAHIGSQILDIQPFRESVSVVDGFLTALEHEGHELETLNFGGGFGISYKGEQKQLDLEPVAEEVTGLCRRHGLRLILEPGRFVIAPAGVLVTQVEYIKRGIERTFVIVDAAMTEIIRPALYQAYHELLPVTRHPGAQRELADVVGPVCESADFLAEKRELPVPAAGEYLAVRDAGAYCSVMASNYNSRMKPAEVMVIDGEAHLIRRRETLEDLTQCEEMPPGL